LGRQFWKAKLAKVALCYDLYAIVMSRIIFSKTVETIYEKFYAWLGLAIIGLKILTK
jgi:hypothetical protein